MKGYFSLFSLKVVPLPLPLSPFLSLFLIRKIYQNKTKISNSTSNSSLFCKQKNAYFEQKKVSLKLKKNANLFLVRHFSFSISGANRTSCSSFFRCLLSKLSSKLQNFSFFEVKSMRKGSFFRCQRMCSILSKSLSVLTAAALLYLVPMNFSHFGLDGSVSNSYDKWPSCLTSPHLYVM